MPRAFLAGCRVREGKERPVDEIPRQDGISRGASIDGRFLHLIARHYYRLEFMNRVRGFAYERCAELPYVLSTLEPRFGETLRYLDIGSGGESPLPTWLLANTPWDITCVDKFSWVRKQREHAVRVASAQEVAQRFHVVETDFLKTEFPARSFDVITNVSVIEHFEGSSDSQAMAASGKLLKPGGIYILTTPVNEGFSREIYVKRDVYGEHARGDKAVYYQRHYDTQSVRSRLIEPSGLVEVGRIYFGDYERQFFEDLGGSLLHRIMKFPTRFNFPKHALRHLSYSDKPVSRAHMKDNTASGVIVVLTRGSARAAAMS
jgi:2-polyprenyl-3-methyl-5-hydroxy-6-metoxy-1,4-benzoquinol methylase